MPLARKHDKFVNYDAPNGRFYHNYDAPNTWYPSVTTIIGYKKNQGSSTKKKSTYGGPAAPIGSLVHYKCLKELTDKILDIPTDPIWGITKEETNRRISECMRMWYELIAPLDIKPLAVESAVYSLKPRYAGRIDMLCKIDGILTLLDIKTGASYEPEHSMQAAAYWHALKRKPKQVQFFYMDAIVGRNPDKTGHIHTYYQEDLELAFDEFLYAYADYGGDLEPYIVEELTA